MTWLCTTCYVFVRRFVCTCLSRWAAVMPCCVRTLPNRTSGLPPLVAGMKCDMVARTRTHAHIRAHVMFGASCCAFQLAAWIKYLDIKARASKEVRFQLYERALKQLPGRSVCARVSVLLQCRCQPAEKSLSALPLCPSSLFRMPCVELHQFAYKETCCSLLALHSYKLWYRYLKERRKAVRGLSPTGWFSCYRHPQLF